MVTVIVPVWVQVSQTPGFANIRLPEPDVDRCIQVEIEPENVDALLSGDVVFTNDGAGTACLTKERLVLTERDKAWIYLFSQPLLGEFITQLDALGETGEAE